MEQQTSFLDRLSKHDPEHDRRHDLDVDRGRRDAREDAEGVGRPARGTVGVLRRVGRGPGTVGTRNQWALPSSLRITRGAPMDDQQYMANEAKRLEEEQRRSAALEAELRAKAERENDEALRREAERSAPGADQQGSGAAQLEPVGVKQHPIPLAGLSYSAPFAAPQARSSTVCCGSAGADVGCHSRCLDQPTEQP